MEWEYNFSKGERGKFFGSLAFGVGSTIFPIT